MRKIWLTRHGESEYNQHAFLGGDSNISPAGQIYARLLPDVIVDRIPLVRGCAHCLVGTPMHLPRGADLRAPAARRHRRPHPPGARLHAFLSRTPPCRTPLLLKIASIAHARSHMPDGNPGSPCAGCGPLLDVGVLVLSDWTSTGLQHAATLLWV